MSLQTVGLDQEFPTGFWTLYYHPSREKRWSIDSFEKVATVKTTRDVLSIFKELGDKIKAGMFFWMKGSIPPLWENFNNIRGGSYSIRGLGDNGIKVFKMYTLACMLDKSMVNTEDKVNGISISPKLQGFGANQQVGYFIIKIWNKDCDKFHSKMNLQCLEEAISYEDVMYTPHVEKKM